MEQATCVAPTGHLSVRLRDLHTNSAGLAAWVRCSVVSAFPGEESQPTRGDEGGDAHAQFGASWGSGHDPRPDGIDGEHGRRESGAAGRDERAVQWLLNELRSMAKSQLSGERVGHTLSATALVNEVYLKLRAGQSAGQGVGQGAAGAPSAGEGGELREDGVLDGPLERRFAEVERLSGDDRARFFGLAARAMRQILIDHARTRGRAKRGGDRVRLGGAGIDLAAASVAEPAIDAAEIAVMLERLEAEHPEAARVVELRFFAGLTEVVIAELMGVTERTVRRHWTFAKAWLHRELSRRDSPDE